MADLVTRGYKGPPRWVKKSAIIVLILILLFVIHFFFGSGITGMHHAAMPQ